MTSLRFMLSLIIIGVVMAATVRADESPIYNRPLSPSEKVFVHAIQTDLHSRFPSAVDAEKAGYFRYTNEDSTGATSYANLQWTSADIRHPSQLWYDKNGNLLGADFSIPNTTGKRPSLFGVNPGRWYEFDDHIHWIGTDPKTGKPTYDNYVMTPRFIKAGGDPRNPSAAVLVKLHKAKSAKDVRRIFDFPKVWDLIVWVKQNPNGAFAEKNPLVKP